MHKKFGLILLLAPSFIQASVGLARLQGFHQVRPIIALHILKTFQPSRFYYTGYSREALNNGSDVWNKVSPAKQDAYGAIYECANELRKAQRELIRQKEKFEHDTASWGVDKGTCDRLVSEDPRVRGVGKESLKRHFIVLQVRAENPPK